MTRRHEAERGPGYPAAAAQRPRRWPLLLGSALTAGVAAVVVWRVPAASADIHAALARTSRGRVPWLGAAAAAETLSLAAGAAGQRRLLAAGGVRLPRRALFGLAVGYAGLASLLPAGTVAATAWLTGQYRRRGASGTLGLWAALAGGFAATVTALGLLLAGAGVAGLASPALMAAAAVILVAGSAGFIAVAHRAGAVGGRLARCHPGAQKARRLAAAAAGVAQQRAGYQRGTAVLALSGLNELAGAAVLAAAFELAGLRIPWHGLLLTYASGQLAGSLVPLPGGLGGVEGGLLGALTLTGTPLAAAAAAVAIYRVLGYWAVGAVGTVVTAAISPPAQAGSPNGRVGEQHPHPTAGTHSQHRRGPGTEPAPVRRHALTWPRLPAAVELATLGAGYAGYRLIVLALPAGHRAAFAHAAQLWRAERWMHLNIEPYLNHLVTAHAALAEATGYYYGLFHFIVTPLVLAWLYLRRATAFPRLRSALVLATTAANVVFWTWPLAPPRFAVPVMTDILVARDILGAADPHGTTSLVNLYAAMPSLHVAWAVWCALAVVTTTRSRWHHLAWLYPAVTTLVVLATANHFLLDAVGGLAITALGMLATSKSVHWHPAHNPRDLPSGQPGAWQHFKGRKVEVGVVPKERQQPLVDQPAERDAERSAGGGQDHRLRAEDPPDLAAPGAHTAQDPDLAGALDDAHAEGADQADEHDDHHQEAQDLHDGEDGGNGSGELRLRNVDLRGADRVPGGSQPVCGGGGRPVDGGVGGTGGGEPDGVRGAGHAVQARQHLQREVDDVARVVLAGVDPDDVDPGGSRGHGEGENLPGPRAGGAREGGAEHHRRDGCAGAPAVSAARR